MAKNSYVGVGSQGCIDNLRKYFDMATAEEIEEGKIWYSTAHDTITELAHEYDIAHISLMAVVALISPGRRWEHNISGATQIADLWLEGLSEYEFEGQMLNRSIIAKGFKALDIWQETQDTDETFWTGIVAGLNPNGLKVPNFFLDILHYNVYRQSVCIDSHMVNAYEDFPASRSVQVNQRLYMVISDATVLLCAQLNTELGLNLIPSQLQAIIWIVRKRLYPDPTAKKRVAE